MAYLECAFVGYLTHDALDECGLALAVVTYKGYFLSALDGEVDVGENGVGIGFGHIVADDGEVTAAQAGRKLQTEGAGVDFVYFYGHYLFEHLDA